MDELNNKELPGSKTVLTVCKFLNKTEREEQIRMDSMKYKNSKKRCNLFVKNIPDNCTEQMIKDLFKPYGEIESVRLFPKDPK